MRAAFLSLSLFVASQAAGLSSALAAPPRAEIVDRIVAVVDKHVITWSAALDEANYQAFRNHQEPWEALEGEPLRKIVLQMVDQELLEKEKKADRFSAPSNAEAGQGLQVIRKQFQNSEAYQKALARYKLTDAVLLQRLERENGVLAFIDFRLRPQARLSPEMAEAYYRDTLLPELRRHGQVAAPPLEQVRRQIEDILIQKEIDHLLEAWLQDLRHRAQIKIMV